MDVARSHKAWLKQQAMELCIVWVGGEREPTPGCPHSSEEQGWGWMEPPGALGATGMGWGSQGLWKTWQGLWCLQTEWEEQSLFSCCGKYKTLKNNTTTPATAPRQLRGRRRFSELCEGCKESSRSLKLLHAPENLLEGPKLKPQRVWGVSTGSAGGWITLEPLRAVASGGEWVEGALRALVLLLGITQALVSVPGVLTSLWVHREMWGFTGNA